MMKQCELFRPAEPRAGTHRVRILARLRAGPATNAELNDICFRYSARIFELRRGGHTIDVEKLGDGLTRYTLRG